MGPPLAVMLFSDAAVYGGGERYLELLATSFDRDAVNPRIVLATEPELDAMAERLSARGLAVSRLPRAVTLSDVRAFMAIFRHFAWNRPDLVHVNLVDPRACNASVVAAKLAGHRSIVSTEHLPHSPFDDLPTPLRHRVAMAVIRHHIVVSRASSDALLARGVPGDRVSVIHNGIPDPGLPSPGARAEARAVLWPGHPGPLVGFAARLVAQKQPQLFLEAIAQVVREHAGTRAVVLGDGPDRQALEHRARELGVIASVRFLGHRPDAPSLYAGLDVLVSTSSYEGLPFTLLEAMVRAVPVVVRLIPGIDEAVTDGVTGITVASGSPGDFASAVNMLLRSPERRAALGEGGRRRILESFSALEMTRRTVEVYHRTLTRRRTAATQR